MRMRITSMSYRQFLLCVKHQVFGSNKNIFRNWKKGDYLVFSSDKTIVGVAKVSGDYFFTDEPVWDNDVFPDRMPIDFIHATLPENRIPIDGKIKKAITSAWGKHYGWAIVVKKTLPEKNAKVLLESIKSCPNDLAVINENIDILTTPKRTVLSLFSGCGGMDLGFEGNFDVLGASVNTAIHDDWVMKEARPGWVRLTPTCFETVFANDIKPSAKASWVPYFVKRGLSSRVFHLGSIVDFVNGTKKRKRSVFPSSVDIVTGGFPCQDFSVAGKRNGFNSHRTHTGALVNGADDPSENNRGMLYMWMRKVINIAKPKVFIAENVKGLLSLANVKDIITKDFSDIGDQGYVVVSRLLKAIDYGVPQTRERVFFIGFDKSSLTPEALEALSRAYPPPEFDPFPTPTHFSNATQELLFKLDNLSSYVTVGQTIADLPEPEKANGDLSHASYSGARWMGSHCQGQTEVSLDAPGPTIRSEHHGNIEFRRLSKKHGGKLVTELKSGLKERRLTVRECARLQTFPDDYEFVRKADRSRAAPKLTTTEGYKLVGNAVPPLLAYQIARRLQELWPLIFKEK